MRNNECAQTWCKFDNRMCVGRTAQWMGDMCDSEMFDMFATLDVAGPSRNIAQNNRMCVR
jgi:hypothetical protein